MTPEEAQTISAQAHSDQIAAHNNDVFGKVNHVLDHLIQHARFAVNTANAQGATLVDAGAALGQWMQDHATSPHTFPNLLAAALLRLVEHTPEREHTCTAGPHLFDPIN